MKLMTMTQISVDGVMRGNGGASDEDGRSGFERGGWAMGVFDDETLAFITQTYQSADAFLFGRRTYEVFAPCWGAMDRGSHPIADALNRWPLANDLVDEMNLLIVPVIVGQGTRLFPDNGPEIALDLVGSRADSKGVTLQVYGPVGRPQYRPATADLKA